MIAGLIGDDSLVYRCNLGNAMAITISGALQFSIATGDAFAGGRHFYIDEESQIVDIDPCSTGYSRIDDIYVVFRQDTTNNYDSMDIVTCHGTEYATGGTEVEPATPPTVEGYTTVSYYKILRVYVSDSTISTYTDYTYLLGGYKELTDNLADAEATIISEIGTVSEQIASDLQSSVETLETTVSNMQTTFQDGVDTIYNAIVAEGVTPSSSTPEDCATGISTVATNKYNTGYNTAQSITWSQTLSMALYGYTSDFITNSGAGYSLKNVNSFTVNAVGDAVNVTIGDATTTVNAGSSRTFSSFNDTTVYFDGPKGSGNHTNVTVTFNYQAKILR
jgi:hypothetical protein